MATEKSINLKESLKNLNEIVEWFESREEIDVEAGLEKVKKGAELVKACKKRLTEIENEFEAIKKDVGEDEEEDDNEPEYPEEEPDNEIDSENIPI